MKLSSRGMIPYSTTSLSSPAPWSPQSSSALPVGSGLDNMFDAWARALAMSGCNPV
jgi:hypothetical protein